MGFRTVLIFSQLGIALAFCLVVVLGFNNVIDTLEGPPSNLPKLVILNLHSQLLRYLLVAIIISVCLAIVISWAIAKRASRSIESVKNFLEDLERSQSALEQYSHPNLIEGFAEFSGLSTHLNKLVLFFQNDLNAARHSAQMKQLMLDNISEAIMLIDQKFFIEYGNQSAFDLLGIDSENSIGLSLFEIDRTTRLNDIVKRCIETRKAQSDEILLDNVSKVVVSLAVIPIFQSFSSLSESKQQYLIVMQDISMLRKLQQVRSDFVTNASHELRTPLTAIQGYAETLLDKANGKKKQRQQFIVRIYEQAVYLSGLISDLLNLSKIESGSLQLNFETCKIADLRKKITNLFEPLFSESKMNFEWEIPDDPTEIYVDPELITQVLVNLIDNAIKYTESGGTISVSFQTKEDNIIFQIKDMGIGIPKQELERIFERFYRVDTDSTNKVKGTGLGLSIAKHIVLQHDGRIWVESEVGKGTSVFFSVKKGTAK